MRCSRALSTTALLLATVYLTGCHSGEPPTQSTADPAGADTATETETANAATQQKRTQEPVSLTESTADSMSQKPSFDPLHPVVEIQTNLGSIQLELDAERAPGTVSNFLEYVKQRHYEGTVFHYVDPQSMILGGGYDEQLELQPAMAPIRNEAHNGKKNRRGTVAMSRRHDVIDSATSEFFINTVDNPALDHQPTEGDDGIAPADYGYCVFGEVTEGMDVVEKIGRTQTQDEGEFVNTPAQRVVIQRVRRLR